MMAHRFTLIVALSILSFAVQPLQAQDADASADPPKVQLTVDLLDGSKIIGPPIELTAIPMKVDFGEVSIGLPLLQQITFTKDRASIVAKFRNGDQLTGALLLKQVKVKTAFGPATILVERIAKVSIVPK